MLRLPPGREYLRGREFMLGKEKNLETFGQAIKYFRQALEHDPNYSLAYVCLGFAYMFDYQNRWTERRLVADRQGIRPAGY